MTRNIYMMHSSMEISELTAPEYINGEYIINKYTALYIYIYKI